mmetsp:Transcript_24443/g.48081  ORF Transcript_24443/g.48081 Transcript_24443/m.48081 type:complete len:249 (+) Transcript_24443:52-798(+)|eukprot:CAMPEP_0175098792 /NCGR_PEP_ID=MMETSP0086_2-20121207/6069_1 /TAXON_ID=136419 /ORGANISM="Unknown Unknown, Strain D1" /LENGTH=248 /DNA_ID=CAMNT_0016372513 /DNA_START=52 /DNA_END=798 /DNA_ORIENTATION=-
MSSATAVKRTFHEHELFHRDFAMCSLSPHRIHSLSGTNKRPCVGLERTLDFAVPGNMPSSSPSSLPPASTGFKSPSSKTPSLSSPSSPIPPSPLTGRKRRCKSDELSSVNRDVPSRFIDVKSSINVDSVINSLLRRGKENSSNHFQYNPPFNPHHNSHPQSHSQPAQQPPPQQPQQYMSDNSEKLFSKKQVKKILRECLAAQEEQLREEYDKKLNVLLQEQYDSFNRFNQDCISRSNDKNDYFESYIS